MDEKPLTEVGMLFVSCLNTGTPGATNLDMSALSPDAPASCKCATVLWSPAQVQALKDGNLEEALGYFRVLLSAGSREQAFDLVVGCSPTASNMRLWDGAN